ncbi:hypothetical protein MMAD_54250 [Mycolicibacterium madagascariense]|uniref:DUF3566 domain-containing protein n=1 Tax=Mycolicibacterium madagascariense TaxID=212765 RepID=A0A7I7XPI5_9MYCO|nr:DUF3566 domain-containing protein [Mycolicibacterium madagascariense]MCV7014105.1 DUF3566 domain-containing protein [Mycolicibacterium madagascariense]BBZ31130.1 hypothetical protein MMAD_54250 [Mycolicibacterium madagascariense]
MGSPNEPGPPRATEGTGGANGSNGTHEAGPNGPSSSGDVPPWQRGPARPRPQEGPRAGAVAGHSPGPSPGPDARLNRFIAGGPAAGPSSGPAREATAPRESAPRESAPARESESGQPTRVERPESGRPDTYASELPDLSGPAPRSARKPAAERPGGEPVTRTTTATRASAANRSQGPVRASMQIRRLDPWSVLKVSLVLSVSLFFVWMIAVAFLYLVLGGMGVWSKLNSNVGDLLTSGGGSGGELVSSGTIFGGAALIGLVNIVLLTAMATCGAFIYNLTTDLVGGIEVTLADRD